ncbi:outer membrane beta-barrel protein [Hymenobacter terrigena]
MANRFSQRTAETVQPARAVAVQLAAGPGLPTPQLVAVAPSPLPLPFASHWAVQVVAGPALTYRTLNTGSAGASASTFLPTNTNSTTSAAAALERPALGSTAQVTVRRTLGGHWSLSAGLGYAEYAAALALQQVHAATTGAVANSLDSASATTGIHRRDTYRFVTVPMQVGYGWTLSGRWRVGVLAGAEAAVYVGGSSTEGSSCACQSQTWSFNNSPYRRVSVGASLGAEVRYRLGEGGRWELLAQPTATYLLTPLAPATSAYYQRHLVGGAALLGAAFNLP